ncbi:MAG: VanZ family protein [Synergistes sp.]|nr:VanZ family protein [Synergistes sp.]
MFNALDIPIYYYLIAIGLGVAAGLWRKRWIDGILASYLFIVFAATLLARKLGVKTGFTPELFWSWKRQDLRAQIYANIVMFILVGFLLEYKIGWKCIPAATMISVFIEIVQLITKRGLFEFDDIIHNTLGAFIGYLIVILLKILGITCQKIRQAEGIK